MERGRRWRAPRRGWALNARRSAGEADAPATRRALPPMGKSTDRKRVGGRRGTGAAADGGDRVSFGGDGMFWN